MSYIKGNYKKTIFSGNSGYIVGLFKIKDSSDDLVKLIDSTITFTGYFHELNDLDIYIFNGNIVEHKKYGEQFLVNSYERVKPEEKDAIVEFLSSGLFKGIGEKKAIKIVNVLGKDTLNIILENPSNLLLIPTITKKQVDILHNTLVEYEKSYDTILKLTDIGFNTKESITIYNKYKENTNNIISDNIYKIINDVNIITFKKIDKIALDNNYLTNDERRIKAGIIYALNEVTSIEGHSYFSIDEVYNYTVRALSTSISDEEFINSLNSLILDLEIIKNDDKYYLKNIYEAEENISSRIKYLMNLKDDKYKGLIKLVNSLELLNNITYNEKQRKAIEEALIKNILVITGGPGTGKTTIINSIVELYKDINKLSYKNLLEDIALLAPTGRASKRLSETTNLPATTIHRFLKWNKDNDKFSVNEYNKSDVKLVIIDEVSMVDTYLMDNLLKGLRVDTKIIMVGDYDQLPSVGPGQILKDIIESDSVNVIKLEELYRQVEGSNIISLAYDIKNESIDRNIFNKNDDLTFIETTDIINNIKEICKKYKEVDYKDFQVLVPLYKTIDGIDNLNYIMQGIFNPESKNKKEIEISGVKYREDDKVIQLTNMPEENVFNGDIGIIKSIDNKEINIDFYGNLVKFVPSNYNNFKHGYAISIHKSQGSEFTTVVIPVVSLYKRMLYKKLYYTAVTRSKSKLILLGELDALEYASHNNSYSNRKTTLKEKLINKIKINE